ncbi:MAG: serine/threonine protein kinase [Oligoflexia bacterium]|nr:serine/threonine protein kinase [Oligoflexia bacterium]
MNELGFSTIHTGTLLFGRFEVVRCLHLSEQGAVYLCRDRIRRGLEVALKVFAAESLPVGGSGCIRREMILAASVDHPNVIKTESFFQDENYRAFSMEYVSGGTLAEQIDRSRILPLEFCEKALIQICSALRAIHRSGVLHRDLKPENILVDVAGNLKVADFGIAAPSADSAEQCNQSLIGTMNYLSPEYIEKGVFDERSDIYALGVIGYELITGRLPFKKGSLLETLTSRVRFDAAPPHTLRKDCPLQLSAIVLKALQRAPDKRFQSAQEMLIQLESLRFNRGADLQGLAPQMLLPMLSEINA